MNKVTFHQNLGVVVVLSLLGAMPKMVMASCGIVATKGYTSESNLNIRQIPSQGGKKLTTLAKDSRVELLTKVRGENVQGNDWWYQVKTPNGVVGYANGQYLKETECAGSKTVLQVQPGSKAKVMASCGIVATKGYTSESNLNVRQIPSQGGKSLNSLPKDTQVELLTKLRGEDIQGNDWWYRVKTPNGVVGYASGQYLKETKCTN